MLDKVNINIRILNSKLGYILACLTSYSSLDLSKGLKKMNDGLFLIAKSLDEDKVYLDIRNVIELKKDLEILKAQLSNDDEIVYEGHKIACLLFEFSLLAKQVVLQMKEYLINEEFIEYLTYVAEYGYVCARIVNIQILWHENKLIEKEK